MNSPKPDVDSLIDALRSDLPSAADERRMRARMLAAGLTVGAGSTLPATLAAAPALGVKATLLSKLATLSWGAKVGLAGAVVAAAAAGPVTTRLASDSNRDASDRSSVAASATLPPAQLSPAIQSTRAEPTALAEADDVTDNEPPEVHAPLVPKTDNGVEREPPQAHAPFVPALPRPSGSAPEASPNVVSTTPSVGALPALDDAPEDILPESPPSTLRQESELVERALLALRVGDAAAARRSLHEHARRFPNGKLRRERERALLRANDINHQGGGSPPLQ